MGLAEGTFAAGTIAEGTHTRSRHHFAC